MTTAATLTQTEAQARAALLKVQRYTVELDLRTAETFGSTVTATFTCREPGASSWIDLAAVMVRRATLNGVELELSTYADGRLPLPGLAEQNTLVVEATCAYPDTGEGLYRFTDPADGATYVTSQCAPMTAHRIHACFDQPDLKASWQLAVTAPEGWTVLANGAVAEQHEGSWRFAETERMATYLFAVCAGPWHTERAEHDGIALSLSCRASLAEHLEADDFFAITRASFDHYHQLFGVRYPFSGGYDQVYVPDFNWGAMENPGCVTFNESYLFRSRATRAAYQRRAETIAHEMAHMWFGNLVTMRWWDDTWLNESFATYMSAVVLAEATEYTSEWTHYAVSRKARAARQDQLPSTHPVAADIPDVDAAAVNFDAITYDKGASVLKQLVAYVGRDAFLAGLRTYFDRHAFGSATLADLLTELSAASGRDLASWSRMWLETSGVDMLTPRRTDGGIEVEQTGEVLRPHRIAVGSWSYDERGALARNGRVEVDIDGPRVQVPDTGEVIVVNDDDLTYAKVRFDPQSLEVLTRDLSRIDSPLTRAVCWTALWDATRDAELPAHEWLAIVEQHVDVETDPALLQWLQAQALEALHYIDPSAHDHAGATLTASSWRRASAAVAGSDAQLSWVRTWASAAGPSDAPALRGLLDGSSVPAGLAVDTELRWHLLRRLVALHGAGETHIAAELARDRTTAGERQAAACRAAVPTAEAKAAAWAAVTSTDELPKAVQAAVLSGFHTPGHCELLAPYAASYIEVVDGLWRERATEKAMLAATALYPRLVVSEQVLELVDGWLADDDHPAACRRLVSEGRDETARALRARAADA